MSASPSPRTHRFQNWELRPRERLLLVNGNPAKVGSRAFDVLLALVEHQGRTVGKTELMDAGWPGLVVEENNLSVQISTLRKLLGAGTIVNVSGHGYQLAATPAAAAETLPESLATGPSLASLPPLVGRDQDFDVLKSLVATAQLVTIVGTGGVGKTALAKTVMARSGNHWRDGVHWIDLSPLRSGALLIDLVVKSLGVVPDSSSESSEDLMRSLSQMQAWIALDNCEHLLDEVVALLAPLLRSAPKIRWLLTSHEPLHLVDESVYRLGPLDVPLPGTPLDEAVRYGALALLCDRARAADRRFELTPDRVDTAIDLCRQIDGLPLAIEMAAARVATLGLQGVHDQIDQRLRLRASNRDAPSRHHTLQHIYEWSYGLLSPVEQCVFRRLEPFAGGFGARMAQQLCCSIQGHSTPLDPWAMLDALSALVDKSLVQRGQDGALGVDERLYLLESARDYARLRLEGEGEIAEARQRHAEVVADRFTTAQHELERWRDRDWAAKYIPERRNVCVALTWACSTREPDLLARLISALAQLDSFIHTHSEVMRYVIPMDVLDAASLPLRARALMELGWAHYLDGHRELGTDCCLRALADFERLADATGIYTVLTRLIRLYDGRVGMEDRAREMWSRLKYIDESQIPLRLRLRCHSTVALLFEGERSVERLEELHRIARHAGFDAQAAVCRINITDELLVSGRYEDVVVVTDSMLQAGEPLARARAFMCHNRAHALVRLGRVDEARSAARTVLRILPSFSYLVIDLFAFVAAQSGRFEAAALMSGCSSRIKRERGLHADKSEQEIIAETLVHLDREIGAARADELKLQGAAMSTADVLELIWGGPARVST